MVKTIALDTSSTSTGWAIFIDGKYSQSGCINLKKIKDGNERKDAMCLELLSFLDKEKPDIVCWESVAVVRNPQVLRMLIQILSAPYIWCLTNKQFYKEYRPTEWRKLASYEDEKLPKKREELKSWSMQRVKELYGKDVESDDESDSILIGLAYMKEFNIENN